VILNQFDVVQNPFAMSAKKFPFLVVLQSDYLNEIDTVVVSPLRLSEKSPPVRLRLNPVFEIEGGHYQLMPELITSMLRRQIKKRICTVSHARDEIRAALDFLLIGF
jgi:toxin CcdB